MLRTASSPPAGRRRWLFRLAIATGVLVVLLVAAWLAVPPLVRSQLETRLTNTLGRPTTVEAVAFDPLVADISAASLWHRAPVLDALRVVRPSLYLRRDRDDRYNVQDLVDRATADDEPGPPPRFSLNNIEIAGGSVTFDDRIADQRHALTALDIAVPFISSLPYDTDIRVTPHVAGAFNGSRFAVSGTTTTPFADQREGTLEINLDALPLPQYLAYLPARPAYDLASGALSTRLTLAFVEGDPDQRRLELRGAAHIDDLAVRRRDGQPLLGAARIGVLLDRVLVFGRDARIDALTVDKPELVVRRFADGSIELAQPLFEPRQAAARARSEAQPARAGPEWQARLGTLAVTHGSVTLVDDTSGFRTSLVDVDLDASNLSTVRGEKAKVALAFVSSDRIATFAADAEVEPMIPTATGRFELANFSLSLLFPYYRDALAADVQKGSLDFSTEFTLDAEGNARLQDGIASVRDLRLAVRGQRTPLWRMPELAMSGVAADIAKRSVEIDEVQVAQPALRLVRERDGTLEMTRIFRNSDASRAKRGADADGDEWTIVANRTTLKNGSIDVEDRATRPVAKVAVRNLDLTATGLSNAARSRSQIGLRARVGPRGRIAFDGPVTLQPLALSGAVAANDLALQLVKPYVEPEVNVVLTGGTLSAKGRLAVAPDDESWRATWKGTVSIAEFAALDKPTSSDLARWKSLAVEDLELDTSPFRASAGRIALDDFYARAIVYPDATLNLARLVTPGVAAEPEPDAKPAPRSDDEVAEGLPIAIGRIDVSRGNVHFSDLFVRPNYSANLTDVEGSVSALSREQAGDVALTARVEGTAPVEVKGTIHPFAPELALDIAANARDIELPPLSPYAIKYAGYGIEKGKLTFDVRYRIEERRLAADNRLVLDQLTFGERVESPTATKLPVLLAVSLLKDSRGVIDINLPIAGSLDDPQFSIGGLIVRVVVNLLTRAVTAPFSLLAAAFGGGEELSRLEFEAGNATIDAAMEKRIDTLAKALADRPGLKLEIGGRADPAGDREALRVASIDAALRREKMKWLARDGSAPSSIAQVTIADDERERWLRAAYREAPLPDRPRNFFGMLKDVPPEDMEAMLLAHASVDDEALRTLATRRAQAVKDALVARGIAPERLFITGSRLAGEPGDRPPAGDKPPAGDAQAGASAPPAGAKGASPARVELSLR